MSALPRPLPTRASQHLDLLRGLCAIFVLLGHLRGIFLPYAALQAPGPVAKLIYFVCGYGVEMVVIFFVLSGFFISTAIWRARASGTWSWGDYLLRRSVRLYLVLIPALVLGALWDRAGIGIFGLNGTEYARLLERPELGTALAVERYSPLTGLGNLFFLQKILVPNFGSNVALWSLANEFWYYLAFPAFLLAFDRKESWTRRLANGALAVAILWFTGAEITRLFSLWLLGALVGWLWARGRIYRGQGADLVASAGLVALIGSLALTRAHVLTRFHLETISVSCAFLVWGLLGAGERRGNEPARSWYKRLSAWAASFSYSLYLVHYPVVAFSIAAVESSSGLWPADSKHFLYGGTIATAIVAYAYVCSRFTEARTEAVRRGIAARLGLADKRATSVQPT